MGNQVSGSHPLIPVMRNTKLPLILVQLTNLSMLLESTVWAVCRLAVPIPSHAGVHGKTAQHTSKTPSNKECLNCAGLQSDMESTPSESHCELQQCWGSSNKACLSLEPTFGADVSTRDAHLNAVLLHLHLVAGARSHAGAVIHHKVI